MKKITALFFAANPKDTARLRLDDQLRLMTKKIRAAEYRDAIELVSIWAVRADDLLQSLNMHQPHIVHFSGHGTEANELLVEGDDGKAKPIGKAALRALFATFKDNIRLVIFDACYSRVQAESVAEEIDCVMGMNDAVPDKTAIIFMASFYRALGFGRSVQNAFDQAKVALLLEGIQDTDIPELLCKPGIDPSTLFLVEKETDMSENTAKSANQSGGISIDSVGGDAQIMQTGDVHGDVTGRDKLSSIHIGELVMGNQTKKSAGNDFIEHVEHSNITMGDTNIGRDNIVIAGNAKVKQFTTGASFQGDHAQQLLQSTTPQSPKEDILKLLSFVQQELSKLPLPEDVKEEVAHEVKGAEIQLKKDEPDKEKAGQILQHATEALEKVPKLTKAAVTVGNLLGQAILWCGMKSPEWKYGE